MGKAVFLNPLKGGKAKMKKNKRKIKSPRLKRWLGVVKKHGGDMGAAAKEWRSLKTSGVVNPRRSAKGLMPEHQRRAVVRGLARTAAKELSGKGAVMAGRRRNQAVPKPKWRAKWEKATGLKMKATKKLKTPSVPAWYRKLAAGTKGKGGAFEAGLRGRKRRPSKKKGIGKSWREGIMAAARKAGAAAAKKKPAKVAANPLGTVAWRSSLVSGLRRAGASPKFISQVQKGLKDKASMNMVNALALNQAPVVGTLKQLLSVEAMKDYGFVGTGFVAGAVFPTLATKGLAKLGVVTGLSGTAVQVLLGIGGSLVAAVLTGVATKDANRAQQVAAGGLAGVLGGLAVQHLERLIPMQGLGQDAERAVEAAVEAELRRELGPGVSGGVGQFVTEAQVERELAGVGQFVETSDVEEAPMVAGMGAEAGEDIEEVADAFGYAD